MTRLRHILDKSINAAYFTAHGVEKKNFNFPVAGDESNFNGAIKRAVSELSEPVEAVLKNARTFKGGDDALYAMCVFANSKHKAFFLDVSPDISNTVLMSGYSIGLTRLYNNRFLEAENCFELSATEIDGQSQSNIRLTFEIVIKEAGGLKGENALKACFELLQKVSTIHKDIKSAAEKLI